MDDRGRGKGGGRGRNGKDMEEVRAAKSRKLMLRPAAASTNVSLPKVREEDRLAVAAHSFVELWRKYLCSKPTLSLRVG